MHHWTPQRIKAHVFICMLALIIERGMRLKLKNARQTMLPTRALELLRTVRVISARTSGGEVRAMTQVNEKQRTLFKALVVPGPKLQDVQ